MPRPHDRLPALAAAAAIAIGLAFRLRTIALPTATLTSRYLADDYFYYLNVGWNLAHGYGSSFDGGLTTTNGYQPLFLGLLTALFSLGISKPAAIHAGLAIQAAAAALAALLAYRMLAAHGTPWAGVAVAALLSLNLFFVLPSLTGFEMALALAALLAAAWAWQDGRPPLIVGLFCGLAVLARVDSLALPFAFGVLLVAEVRRRTDAAGAMRDLVALTGGVLIVAGPWLLWNWIAFGSPLPDSGVMKAHYRGIADAGDALMTAGLALPRILLPGRGADWLGAVGHWSVAFIAVPVLAGAVRGAMIQEFRPLAVAALGLLLAYVFLIGAGEPGALVRYLYPVWAIIAILLFGYVSRMAPHAGVGVVLVVLALHLADLAVYVRWDRTAPLPLTYVAAAHTLAPAAIARLRPDERLAAFDAGALGYFSPRPVVNLDGLANHDIVELRRACGGPFAACLETYLRSKGITTLAGGTGFRWTADFPAWERWERAYESPQLADGARLVIVRLP